MITDKEMQKFKNDKYCIISHINVLTVKLNKVQNKNIFNIHKHSITIFVIKF